MRSWGRRVIPSRIRTIRQEWYHPWPWLVGLDTGLVRQQETIHGKLGHAMVGGGRCDGIRAFVLALTLPACTVTSIGLTGADRLSLLFTTEAGLRYLVRRSPRLVLADWQAVPAARTPTGAVEIEPLTGRGAPVTLFVERGAAGEVCLRIAVEP